MSDLPDNYPDDAGFPPELPPIDYDPETLRESFADPSGVAAHRDRLRAEIRDAADETAELLARGDLVDLLRIDAASGSGPDGQPDEASDEALDDTRNEANAAVDRAEIAGTAAQQHLARLRLARVHQWRSEFVDSNPLYTELLAAAGQFGPVIEAFTHHHAGENDYDQGHWDDAREHFAHARAIRQRLELDEAELSRVALAAAERHAHREDDA